MKNKTKITFNSRFKKTTRNYPKFIILFSFLIIAFTVGDGRSEYKVPVAAASVYSADLDLDNDYDIVTGHYYWSLTQWGGAAFLNNTDNGYFELVDSIFFDCGFAPVSGELIDNNNYIDIFGRHQSSNPHKENIAIIYNYGSMQFDSIKVFFLYEDYVSIDKYSSGDVNGDGYNDIVFSCNNDFFWGIIYNDGTGNFSSLEYFDLSFPPLDIGCSDLNNDGKADVVVTGNYTEIFFSTETGFQQQLLTETPSYGVLISDFDNDDDKDIILSTIYFANHHHVYFFENLGNNEFYEHDYFDFTPACSYTQIADFNNDSLPDMVFIAGDHSGLYIYNNIGDFIIEYQQFIPYENLTYEGLFCEDYDNNGFFDIAFTSGFGQINYYLNILFNDGEGNFQEDPISGINNSNSNNQKPIKCYPNPFSKNLNIEFSVIEKSSIDLSVYDMNGKHIKSITNKIYSPGKYKLMWNGTCKNGKEETGTYLIRLKTGPPKGSRAGSQIQTERVIKIK